MKTFILCAFLTITSSAYAANSELATFAAETFLKSVNKELVIRAEKKLASTGYAGIEELKKDYLEIVSNLGQGSGFSEEEAKCVYSQTLLNIDGSFDIVKDLAFAVVSTRMTLLDPSEIEASLEGLAIVKTNTNAAILFLGKVLSPCF